MPDGTTPTSRPRGRPRGSTHTEFDQRVGAFIRHHRILRGLSQEALAEQLTLTFQQVQKYERGINRLSLERADQVARILQVPLEQLLAAARGEVAMPPEMKRMELEAARAFDRLTDPMRRHVLALTRAIARSGEVLS